MKVTLSIYHRFADWISNPNHVRSEIRAKSVALAPNGFLIPLYYEGSTSKPYAVGNVYPKLTVSYRLAAARAWHIHNFERHPTFEEQKLEFDVELPTYRVRVQIEPDIQEL